MWSGRWKGGGCRVCVVHLRWREAAHDWVCVYSTFNASVQRVDAGKDGGEGRGGVVDVQLGSQGESHTTSGQTVVVVLTWKWRTRKTVVLRR